MWFRSASPPVPKQTRTRRRSHEGSLEKDPSGPPEARSEGGHSGGRKTTARRRGFGKHSSSVSREKTIYHAEDVVSVEWSWVEISVFYRERCRSDQFMVSSVSITGILFYSSCWN